MSIFTQLFKTYTGTKILVALAFMAFANVAFADSESLQKLFNEYNVGKDKQEYIKKQCDRAHFDFNPKNKQEQIYLFETTQIDCEVQHLGEVLGSTQGILASLNYGYDEYDKLLNKYYKLYRAELKKQNKTTPTGAFSHEPNIQSIKNGQDTLLEEQRAWLKLRDSYEAYTKAHHAHIYDINGGGTIYSIEASNARLGFLKMRVNELFSRYLMMITDGGVGFDSLFGCNVDGDI
ncbi:lysozyme inhibitor LprI family protein [Helicobacter cinaedi]|uniref:lysozyme inhibitor LprI family protein n=1 Tax=Helicobacter cinaedi TaxID=213 RepID=UPI000CF06E40|nr:lysozyme inhibitor LprI family protein [Helicobacter cinaedi]